MINIPGYQIFSKIDEGSNSVVDRGKQERDNLPVVLKFTKGNYPSENDNNPQIKEYEIIRSLNLTEVIKA